MPTYEYEACEAQQSCAYCANGFEIIQSMRDARLTQCPKCHHPIRRLISAPIIGRSVSALDDRAKSAGFTKLKRLGQGEYEKVY